MNSKSAVLIGLAFLTSACGPADDAAPAMAAQPITARIWPGPEEEPDYDSVGVFYGTNRNQTGDSTADEFYGNEHVDTVQFGHVWVSIPQEHEVGEVERPPLDIEFFEDPNDHFVLITLEPLSEASLLERMGSELQSSSRDLLVFVHGYNVTFPQAVRRLVQIVWDTEFAGVTFLYSWPSDGTIIRYSSDEEDVTLSVPLISSVLSMLIDDLSPRRIHLIAHSMGSRVLLRALSGIAESNPDVKVNQIILAAADIDAREFQEQILPAISGMADRITSYASSQDRPLWLSMVFHDNVRLGQSGPEMVIPEGVDVIDASGVDLSFLGHSYIGSTGPVLEDLADLLESGNGPQDRGLNPPGGWRLN